MEISFEGLTDLNRPTLGTVTVLSNNTEVPLESVTLPGLGGPKDWTIQLPDQKVDQSKQYKVFEVEVIKQTEEGGTIRINTGVLDRDNDHVFPLGAKIDNYMKNPTVQWGHNYREPWAVIGKTIALEISENYIDATFELRPATSVLDPQEIVRLLWSGGWVTAASIGFMVVPDKMERNEEGGWDFLEWELLEWSLVPIPANQEALRQNFAKILDNELPEGITAEESAAVDAKKNTYLQAILESEVSDEPTNNENTSDASDTGAEETGEPAERVLSELQNLLTIIKEKYHG